MNKNWRETKREAKLGLVRSDSKEGSRSRYGSRKDGGLEARDMEAEETEARDSVRRLGSESRDGYLPSWLETSYTVGVCVQSEKLL